PVELGSAGISTNIFNCISKLFNIPLLSIATSFVAEDISKNSVKDSASEDSTNGKPAERKQLSSVSTALLLAVGIGIIEALALYLGSGKFLDLMGISSGSSMRIPAQRFLSLRAFGAPAVVVSLALQGVFRGFKDTKTPVLCLGKCFILDFNKN
ncbi:protein detoxification 45, partial [Quercus suber]